MTASWSDPEIEMARPPARRPPDWPLILRVILPLVVFWATVLFLLVKGL